MPQRGNHPSQAQLPAAGASQRDRYPIGQPRRHDSTAARRIAAHVHRPPTRRLPFGTACPAGRRRTRCRYRPVAVALPGGIAGRHTKSVGDRAPAAGIYIRASLSARTISTSSVCSGPTSTKGGVELGLRGPVPYRPERSPSTVLANRRNTSGVHCSCRPTSQWWSAPIAATCRAGTSSSSTRPPRRRRDHSSRQSPTLGREPYACCMRTEATGFHPHVRGALCGSPAAEPPVPDGAVVFMQDPTVGSSSHGN